MVWVGRDLKDHLVPTPPAMSRGGNGGSDQAKGELYFLLLPSQTGKGEEKGLLVGFLCQGYSRGSQTGAGGAGVGVHAAVPGHSV